MKLLRLNLGSGAVRREGFLSVDMLKLPNVDVVHDLRMMPWPFEDESVIEVWCSHFLEHLTGQERLAFFNELWRIMPWGARATIITPYWESARAYGDLTHKWPPVTEMLWFYLRKEWREANAPHVQLYCDFKASWVTCIEYAGDTGGSVFDQANTGIETNAEMIATLVKEVT